MLLQALVKLEGSQVSSFSQACEADPGHSRLFGLSRMSISEVLRISSGAEG